jgi:hypothetical protein
MVQALMLEKSFILRAGTLIQAGPCPSTNLVWCPYQHSPQLDNAAADQPSAAVLPALQLTKALCPHHCT